MGVVEKSEDALVRRARALDPGALAEIYDRYSDGIYRYVYARVSHKADAEDLMEQVFLKMLDAIQGFRPRGAPLSAWLYRIAHNLLVDRYRRAGRETLELREHVQDAAPHANPETVFQHSEDRHRLFEAIRRLTPEQQQVIALRFIDNLEVPQIAEIMRRRPGAVHSMQHRALASLHRLLVAHEEVEVRRA